MPGEVFTTDPKTWTKRDLCKTDDGVFYDDLVEFEVDFKSGLISYNWRFSPTPYGDKLMNSEPLDIPAGRVSEKITKWFVQETDILRDPETLEYAKKEPFAKQKTYYVFFDNKVFLATSIFLTSKDCIVGGDGKSTKS